MGKTISITVPRPLEEELKKASLEQGVSRSRFICNILTNWSEAKKQKAEQNISNITHDILDSRLT
jgi:metal-responsive CopG/Arc/MetJ family transcriptional regulator